MSSHQDKGKEILEKDYDAIVEPDGSRRWLSPGRKDPSWVAGEQFYDPKKNLATTVYNGISIQLPPWHYEKLVGTIGYMHSDIWGRFDRSLSTVEESYRHYLNDKDERETALRKKHPMLQQYWDRYQNLKTLLEDGET